MPNHTIQPPVAFDIDVAPLRSPSKKPESLETWAPAATALQPLCERTNAADSRRATMAGEKIAQTAKHNAKVAAVAEQRSRVLGESTNAAATALAERMAAAATKRAEILASQAGNAGAHVERAMEIGAAARAEETTTLAEKASKLDAEVEAANKRKENTLGAVQAKAAQDGLKAAVRASAKKAELEKKKEQLQDKEAAADGRLADMEEEKMIKMQEAAERGKQVRRNKYSTNEMELSSEFVEFRATVSTDGSMPKPVVMSFDDLVKSPEKDRPIGKSPVQERWEAQAAAAADADELLTKLAGAESRKKAMMSSKHATLAKNNLRVEATKQTVAQQQVDRNAALDRDAAVKMLEAETRRDALITGTAEKAGAHANHAKEISSHQKMAELVQLEGKTTQLSDQITAAAARRSELQAERVTARKEQIQKLRDNFNEKAATRAAELEAKKAELSSRAEAVEARRTAGLVEIRKKAEVFGAAWSPARQEQVEKTERVLSPTKPPSPANLAASLEAASTPPHKGDGETSDSPRKNIMAFLRSTPVTTTPAPAEHLTPGSPDLTPGSPDATDVEVAAMAEPVAAAAPVSEVPAAVPAGSMMPMAAMAAAVAVAAIGVYAAMA